MLEPKLEIYKIILKGKTEIHKRPTFRDFFRTRPEYSKLKPIIENEDIFRVFHQDFFKNIDQPAYNKNEKKLKGFTVAYDTSTGARLSKISSPINAGEVIHGVLDGGMYGRTRNLSKVTSTVDRTPILTDHIVTDQFYFLLYTPIDYNIGILMIQGYSDIKISDIFRKHLQNYFKTSTMKCDFEYYLPEVFREKYLNGATLSTFTFTSGWHVSGGFDEDLPKEFDFNVKIEITDKDPKVPIKYYDRIMMALKGSFFNINNVKKPLRDFESEGTKIRTKEGKNIPIQMEDHEIRPVILLNNVGVSIESGHNPAFADVNKYCRKILEEIKTELLPINATQEL